MTDDDKKIVRQHRGSRLRTRSADGDDCSLNHASVEGCRFTGSNDPAPSFTVTIPKAERDPTLPETYVGAVINARQHAKHVKALARARAEGLVVVGGSTDDSTGWFVDPTVLEVSDPAERHHELCAVLFRHRRPDGAFYPFQGCEN